MTGVSERNRMLSQLFCLSCMGLASSGGFSTRALRITCRLARFQTGGSASLPGRIFRSVLFRHVRPVQAWL